MGANRFFPLGYSQFTSAIASALALVAMSGDASAQSSNVEFGAPSIPVICGSAASSCVAKLAPGQALSGYVTASGTSGYLMIFNATTVPSNGSTTAGKASGNLQDCIYVTAPGSVGINYSPAQPEPYNVGVVAAFSTTGCDTLTLSATAFIHLNVH